jgi:hypothetical protein
LVIAPPSLEPGQHDKIALGVPMTDARRMLIDAAALRKDCIIVVYGAQPFTFTGTGTTRWSGILCYVTIPFSTFGY